MLYTMTHFQIILLQTLKFNQKSIEAQIFCY